MEEIEINAPAPDPGGSGPSAFTELFDRAYPAAVGLAQRAIDRDRLAGARSRSIAEEVATEALTKARARKLRNDANAVARIVGWTTDGCVPHLVGHPGLVPMPPDVSPDELSDEGDPPDLFAMGGLELAELAEALSGIRKADRRVGVLVFAAGFPPAAVAALIQRPETEVRVRLGRVGVRLCDARRVAGATVRSDEFTAAQR